MSNHAHGTSQELEPAAHGDVETFANPGLPPHRHRMADSDPAAARRAEWQVTVLFIVSILGTIGFIVSYFVFPGGDTVESVRQSTLMIGLSLFVSVFFIGAAAVHWAKTLMPDEEFVDARHVQQGSEEDRKIALDNVVTGINESGFGRRPLIKWSMIGAFAVLPVATVFPLGNLGPLPHDKLFHTAWGALGKNGKGPRLTTDPIGAPIRAADVTYGSVYHVMPEGINDMEDHISERAKASVLLIRVDPNDLHPSAGRENWSYEGIIAFSKICTHVGCPVALYEHQTHHLLCPCHQSTFDVNHEAKVVFGPAYRPLPQLPIEVDEDGYLIAQSDFHEPVGPSFWEINEHGGGTGVTS